ncbi:MAG: hypothetical protein HFJ26_01630 [Clostridia bacterium]|jgi:hypothetical protein|nr:hypothetical protein [Clostridia bacterium]
MRIFNGFRIGDIVIYKEQKYRVIALLESSEERRCKIMSVQNEKIVYEVAVQDCEKVE